MLTQEESERLQFLKNIFPKEEVNHDFFYDTEHIYELMQGTKSMNCNVCSCECNLSDGSRMNEDRTLTCCNCDLFIRHGVRQEKHKEKEYVDLTEEEEAELIFSMIKNGFVPSWERPYSDVDRRCGLTTEDVDRMNKESKEKLNPKLKKMLGYG